MGSSSLKPFEQVVTQDDYDKCLKALKHKFFMTYGLDWSNQIDLSQLPQTKTPKKISKRKPENLEDGTSASAENDSQTPPKRRKIVKVPISRRARYIIQRMTTNRQDSARNQIAHQDDSDDFSTLSPSSQYVSSSRRSTPVEPLVNEEAIAISGPTEVEEGRQIASSGVERDLLAQENSTTVAVTGMVVPSDSDVPASEIFKLIQALVMADCSVLDSRQPTPISASTLRVSLPVFASKSWKLVCFDRSVNPPLVTTFRTEKTHSHSFHVAEVNDLLRPFGKDVIPFAASYKHVVFPFQDSHGIDIIIVFICFLTRRDPPTEHELYTWRSLTKFFFSQALILLPSIEPVNVEALKPEQASKSLLSLESKMVQVENTSSGLQSFILAIQTIIGDKRALDSSLVSRRMYFIKKQQGFKNLKTDGTFPELDRQKDIKKAKSDIELTTSEIAENTRHCKILDRVMSKLQHEKLCCGRLVESFQAQRVDLVAFIAKHDKEQQQRLRKARLAEEAKERHATYMKRKHEISTEREKKLRRLARKLRHRKQELDEEHQRLNDEVRSKATSELDAMQAEFDAAEAAALLELALVGIDKHKK